MQVNDFFKKKRLLIVSVFLIAFIVYVLFVYTRLALSPQKTIAQKKPSVERGSIVDRNGKQLAVQTNFYHFGVSPKMIKYPEEFASLVSANLEMNEKEIVRKINDSIDSSFVYIKKKISQDNYEQLLKIIEDNNFVSF